MKFKTVPADLCKRCLDHICRLSSKEALDSEKLAQLLEQRRKAPISNCILNEGDEADFDSVGSSGRGKKASATVGVLISVFLCAVVLTRDQQCESSGERRESTDSEVIVENVCSLPIQCTVFLASICIDNGSRHAQIIRFEAISS